MILHKKYLISCQIFSEKLRQIIKNKILIYHSVIATDIPFLSFIIFRILIIYTISWEIRKTEWTIWLILNSCLKPWFRYKFRMFFIIKENWFFIFLSSFRSNIEFSIFINFSWTCTKNIWFHVEYIGKNLVRLSGTIF